MRRRSNRLILLVMLVAVVGPALGAAPEAPLWGPEIFVRSAGQPQRITASLTVPDSDWRYSLWVRSGPDGFSRVSSAAIEINGVQILGPSDFSQRVEILEATISLEEQNEIGIELRGRPGSALQIMVVGPVIAEAVDHSGGVISLPGVVSVEIPPESFPVETEVTVAASRTAETESDFETSALVFGPTTRAGYEIRIFTGAAAPSTSIEVTVQVPSSFLDVLPSNAAPVLFADMFQDEGAEVLSFFHPLESRFDLVTQTVTATLPPEAFGDRYRHEAIHEAVLVLGFFDPPVSASSPDTEELNEPRVGSCPLIFDSLPVDGEIHVTSQYSPGHMAIDLRADGVPVKAVAGGTVTTGWNLKKLERVHPRCGRRERGWGRFIIIDHGQGRKTIYGHLKDSEYRPTGATVDAGDTIGIADSTGCVSGAHLHLELIPNCPSGGVNGCRRVDPEPCLTQLPDLEIVSVSPGEGSRLSADRTVDFTVEVAPGDAEIPPETSLQLLINGEFVREEALSQAGPVRISGRLPNLWGEPTVTAKFRILSRDQVVDEMIVDYVTVYNWSGINRGRWEVTYTWTYDWRSKSIPGRTALEQHSGNGYMGSWSFGAAPFVETFVRTAWVNEYSFTYDDRSGCTYLTIQPGQEDLLYFSLTRRSCFDPPTELDLRTWLKYGYVKAAEGAFSFPGPEGPDDSYVSELGFRRVGNTDYPTIQSSRSFKSESRESEWTLDFDIGMRRIPPGE